MQFNFKERYFDFVVSINIISYKKSCFILPKVELEGPIINNIAFSYFCLA